MRSLWAWFSGRSRSQKVMLGILPVPFPVVAWVVWFLSRWISKQNTAATRKQYKLIGEMSVGTGEFDRAVDTICAAQTTSGNQLKILQNGDEIFPSMIEAIRQAKYTINMVTFVYWRGDIARQFADALIERSQAGVSCKLLLDAFGAAKISKRLIKKMRDSGVEVRWFRPLSWYDINRLNNRTHRKVLVVDGEIGFTGGVGIAEEWTGHAQDRHHWRDTHIRVQGPAARGLQGAFVDNWFEATSEVLVGDHYLTVEPDRGDDEKAGHTAQVIRSTASNYDTNIETLFMLVLATASQRFWLSTAYFVPTAAFIKALREAAKRGVDVKVITPGPRTNKKLVRWAGRNSYSPLLEAGVHIYEFEPTMFHCKTLVVDGVWGTVGSTNFDNRSFALNDEINICFREAEPVSNLEKQFQLDLARAKEINPSQWKGRGPLERVIDWVSDRLNPEL